MSLLLSSCMQYISISLCVSGLQTAYFEKKGRYKFVRKVLALPFLPGEHILTAF